MTTREIEDRLRGLAWPSPPATLRARVLAAAAFRTAEAQDVRDARVTPIAPPRRLHRPAWRTLPVLLLIATVIVIGACTGLDLWSGREIDVEIARLQAKYGSLDEATVNVPAVPDADNRARIVRAAVERAVPVPGRRYHFIPLPVPSPVPADLRAFADANSAALGLLGEVGTRLQSNWEVDYLGGSQPSWNSLRILSDAVLVAALMDIEAGRPDQATRLIVSGLGISASVRQEPDTVAQLTRLYNIAPVHLGAIRHLLATSTPSAPALKELAWWLAENRTPDPVQLSLLAETKQRNAMFMRMERGEIDPGTAGSIYPTTWPDWPSALLGSAARIGRPFVRTARVRYLRHMGNLLDVQSGPRPRPASVEPPTPPRWALVNRLVDKFTAGTWGRSELGDNFASALGAAELAVALRRFKLERFDYPADLSALVPNYLEHLPIDPYTGRPPIFARQGTGFTLRATGSSPETAKRWALEWDVKR